MSGGGSVFNKYDIIETIDMIEKEHLDIRTVTMGISLLSCVRENAEKRRGRCTIR